MGAAQALESVVRKKKHIVVSEGELRQQQARASPVPPSLLQRVVNSVRRGGGGAAHSTAQLIASLKEEVCIYTQAKTTVLAFGATAVALAHQDIC